MVSVLHASLISCRVGFVLKLKEIKIAFFTHEALRSSYELV